MFLKSILKTIYYGFPKFINTGYVLPCRNYTIEITYRCNLNCNMCSFLQEIYKKQSEIQSREELSTAEWLNILKQFPYKSNVAFTGGEPFVKKEFITLLEFAAKRFNIVIGTNGYLITEMIAKKLIDLKINAVGISIDGDEKTHNKIRNNNLSFEKAINAIKMLANLKKELGGSYPIINVNSVILEENVSVLDMIPDIVKSAGCDSLSFQLLDPSFERSALRLKNKIDLSISPLNDLPRIDIKLLKEKLIKILNKTQELNLLFTFSPNIKLDDVLNYYNYSFNTKNYYCDMLYTSTRISPYGDIYPCLNFKIGNLKESPLYKLINNNSYRRFRKLFCNKVYPVCIGCCKMEMIK
ncbi:MAG: radical SAM protein [Candidatus Hydrogenedentota bacterium]